jgi:ParB-like chromosome segregation protein Spo0J
MKITNVQNKILTIPKWGSTSILRPEKMLLKLSMLEHGWMQPLVVRLSDNMIIDGYQRYLISLDDEKFIKKHGSMIPVIFHDIDEIEAMVLHIRLNRARGAVNSYGLSKLVKRIVASRRYEEKDLSNLFLMHDDEIDLLMSDGLLKKKNWSKYEYSRAWVPIEVAKPVAEGSVAIERPPNADR